MKILAKILLCFVTALGSFAATAADPKEPYAVVSLTFDDALKSVYTDAFPLLKKAGIHGTLYISTTTPVVSGYVSWYDLKEFDADGWEIGAHAHVHQDLTKMGLEEMVDEINNSQRILKERGFVPVSFAAPFGEYGERELAVLKKHYSSNRAAWGNGGINAYPGYDPYNLVSLGVTSLTTQDEIKERLRTIKREGGWLILQFHQIDNGKDSYKTFGKESIYTTTIFPEIINLILKEGVPIRTVRDIIENP